MSQHERRLEREMRDMKEEMKEWKVKMQLERGKREAAESKITDLEGDVEIMKGKLKEERRERERMQRSLEEIREKMKRMEEKARREKERKGKEEERVKVKSEVRLVSASKRKRKDEGRSKVWQRGVIMHKGENWDERKILQEWLDEFLKGKDWELEETSNQDTKKIIFATEEEMEEIWEKREEVNEEGKVRIEQWMSWEERRAKKEAMIIRERKLEDAKRRGELERKGDIRVRVDGADYIWKEEEGRIRKVGEEERRSEEERENRRKKED